MREQRGLRQAWQAEGRASSITSGLLCEHLAFPRSSWWAWGSTGISQPPWLLGEPCPGRTPSPAPRIPRCAEVQTWPGTGTWSVPGSHAAPSPLPPQTAQEREHLCRGRLRPWPGAGRGWRLSPALPCGTSEPLHRCVGSALSLRKAENVGRARLPARGQVGGEVTVQSR